MENKNEEKIEVSIFNVNWKKFISEVYSKCKFLEAIYEGNIYYPHKTKWHNGVIEGRPASDPHRECNAYSEEECTHTHVHVKYPAAIKYNIDSSDLDVSSLLGIEDPLKLLFVGGKLNITRSPLYPNDDHRGSDHFSIELDFETSRTLETPFTLTELIDALYRLKSHKTDSWYEGYFYVERGEQSAANQDKEEDFIKRVHLAFDYGS